MSRPFPIRSLLASGALVAALLGAASPARAATIADLQARADAGDANAQMNLGLEFYRGDNAPADLHRAVTWIRKAADQGYAPAEAMLASLYADGAGVPCDSKQSSAWLRRAAQHGLPQAQVRLGEANDQGKDEREAVRWFQAAADQGDAEGQRLLGQAYLHGRGVAPDPAKGLGLLQAAADKGDASAQDDLGRLYEDGGALPLDLVQARKWFVLAADHCKTSRLCDSAAQDGLRVKAKMSTVEIEAADRVVRAWLPKAMQPAG